MSDFPDRRSFMATGVAGVAASVSARSWAFNEADRPSDLTVPIADGVLHVTALGDRSVRVRVSPSGRAEAAALGAIVQTSRSRASLVTRGDIARIDLPFLSCEVHQPTGQVRFMDQNGRLFLEEAHAGRRLTASSLHGEPIYAAEQAFISPPGERLFGTGCFQDGFLNLRSLPRRLTQVNTQISLPFLLSSRGYGLLWNNTGMCELNRPETSATLSKVTSGAVRTSSVTTTSGGAQLSRRTAIFEGEITIGTAGRYAFQLDIGRKMASRYYVAIDGRVQIDFSNLWLPPTTSFFTELSAGHHRLSVQADDDDEPSLLYGLAQDRTVWHSPVADAVDYVVIAGPSADQIMEGYRDLLGPTPMMPRWAYGYIHCRERFHSSDEIIQTLEEFRRRRLPVDVLVQDWQYWGKYGWNAMRFDEANYPDPADMIRRIHDLNARFMLSVWSKIGRETELGHQAAERGFYIPDTEWIDFFNPDAVDFYCENQNARLGILGVDAWWQDATEPENDDLVNRMTAAGPGERVRLTYPLHVARAVYDGRRRAAPDQRVMILTRSAFLGQHRFAAATWSGDIGNDWETLRRQVPAGLNMAAGGYPYWTVDAGGFFRPGEGQYADPAYHERLLRWFQYATFLPLQRVHGYQTDTEFWRYGEEVEAVARRYLELRYRLLPYIYSMAGTTMRHGGPLMRPLVFDFPQDEQALDEVNSYMFGPGLHVAPVFAPGVETWSVYLPRNRGGWFDFWTGVHRAGGQPHMVAAPIEQIPLHGRAGSILPMGPILQSTAEAHSGDLDLFVFPGRNAAFDLYEDGGLDYAYEKGAFSLIPIRWNDRRGEITLGRRVGGFAEMAASRRFQVHRVSSSLTPLSARQGATIDYSGSPMRLAIT